ncbi:hypothetical protein BKA62DRAFT_693845 [Auriculariales sp. MPI-PUGE-AT-0066]|nr:hypothetical protein BKA62DRAFT_693845 [Auriculariales sp. MPI-PUGE-AT-0066]
MPRPELPEVQRIVTSLNEVIKGRELIQVSTDPDNDVFCSGSGPDVWDEVMRRQMRSFVRYGSLILVDLEGGGSTPVLQLSEFALVQIRGRSPMPLSIGMNPKWNPRHPWPPKGWKLRLHLGPNAGGKPGMEIAFVDPRRSSRIYLCRNPLQERPINMIEYDPLIPSRAMPPELFTSRLLQKQRSVKRILIEDPENGGIGLAGIGDWTVDEALFQARVHPMDDGAMLDRETCHRILEKISYVCKIAAASEPEDYPEFWLFHYRSDKKKRKSFLLENDLPATIQTIESNGMKSFLVKELQLRLAKPEETPFCDKQILGSPRKRPREESGIGAEPAAQRRRV